MSVTITLQADLTIRCQNGGPRITIPSGEDITFPDAVQTTLAGGRINGDGDFVNPNFATALCAAADMLIEAGGRSALAANESEFTPQVVDGVTYNVTFGVDGQATFDSQNVSPSASPSTSVSLSPSVSASLSPSASASRSPSVSVSLSPSVSVSRSPSASPSASSDNRLKANVIPITDALGKLAVIRGVGFQWNQEAETVGRTVGAKDTGVIAQEVEQVFPELVSTDEMGYKRVNYNGLVGVLFAAVSELHAKVNELEKPRAFAAGQ